jgi:hypothetical protein
MGYGNRQAEPEDEQVPERGSEHDGHDVFLLV